MRGPLLALSFAAFSLAWLVFFGAGARIADWDATLLMLGTTALFYWTFRTGQTPPRLPLWHNLALWAVPIYALFQLVPLSPAVLGFLSPVRAVVAGNLGGIFPSAAGSPLSLVPPAALFGFFSLLGYLTAFSLLRDLGWRFVESHPWLPLVPLVAVASLESMVGVAEWLSGRATPVSGTLGSQDNFAGILEIALPFTLVFGFISFRRHQAQDSSSQRPALLAALAWMASLLLLLGLVHSASPASKTVVASSCFTLLCLGIVPRLKSRKLRWYGAGLAAATAILLLLLVLPPATFTESLAKLGAAETSETSPEVRLAIWNGAAAVLGDYRWFGTGPGGFEPAFLKYQGSISLDRVVNPDSDVLYLLITFGAVGFVLVLIALAGILRPAITGALYLTDEPRRLLAAALIASFLGALIRGSMEANLSIHAIALAFAWVAGLSQSSGLE